ncbi:oxaloacetate decarboxylase alpha subunit [Caldicellulosiruptor bescii]|jgi:oxaloacetate decarboxylase alpha subunit|uniref:Conserved carboxylase region n=2 Tax=Caldicellulosiruptor bescii TaxID=31899 RepID=B9MRW5_CALBD|nr:oxaloacetate decarboxylase subunit alpha [Caldicellulosiruptor bescii]ACM60419.1 Conserved carboxylase region [Caldicellulosiruptor bescii DSM 6725]PBC87833.1 oxaloacetate decarboxylase alpha subunit [Caldicellulosiruptor bescii]PBC90765.1 oxaloacetate decarboxylase alpha subunit [Caldicellulosiruptor bescii]PBD03802.1 oxaloacetate decarboxylase alpha subunit [Caldicellulosiruptor bescii]PBD06563.1 oxaloacetate decarboxylase alpha subunit [Caldicellulosiruptor bescii]
MGVKITETILRDAHQSLIATRMTTEQMLEIAPVLDQVGYYSVECWGGATFDACLRFFNEDPWERLKRLRTAFKKTKLQMLLRGQNLVGYRHYSDDVVEEFVKKAIYYGIDIIRIFDALNDIRNIEMALKITKKEKGHAQVAISYTVSPYHTIENYVNLAKQIEELGADSICIKDMAGLLSPFDAYKLVKALKEQVKLPIHLHTHYTTGFGSMTYLKAVEAGVDGIDTALSPLALGTSQPPTETIVYALENTEYAPKLDLEKINEASEYFKVLREEYIRKGLLDPKVLSVDINALHYQIPGGMLSNLISQLKEQGQEDKLDEVLKEVPEVRKDFGYPPLVTPTSQIVGTQAVLNVIAGERYKLVTKETKAYFKGEYGKPPAPVNEEVKRKILKDEKEITCRPADLILPELENAKEKIKEYIENDTDVVTYCLFPQLAENFFKLRFAKKYKVDADLVQGNKVYPV